MTCASRIFNHSKKFRHAHDVLKHGNAILMCWFTNDAKPSVDKVDKVSRFSQLGHWNERGISMFSSGGCFNISNGAVNLRRYQLWKWSEEMLENKGDSSTSYRDGVQQSTKNSSQKFFK